MTQKTLSWLGTAVLACSTQAAAAADVPTAAQQLDQITEQYFETYLERNPLAATYIGDHRYDDRLAIDIAPAYVEESRAIERRYLDAARAIDLDALSEQQRLTLEIFLFERERALARLAFPGHLMPVSQLSGLQSTMPVLASGRGAQPFTTVDDYERFLARIDDFAVWVDQAIENMRDGIERGVTLPQPVMQRVVPQLEAMIVEDPEDSLFFGAVREMPGTIGAEDRRRIEQRYRQAILATVVPAYQRLHDFLIEEYLPAARRSVGWSALPDGAAWYALLAAQFTTTDLPPERIHAIGLEEVARIRGEMDAVRREVGFDGDLPAFFEYLQNDPRFYFDRPEQLVEGYRQLKKRIDARLPSLFADFPKADYEVRAVEAFRAASSAGAFYQRPSEDGSRPGIFYVNTYNLKAQPKFGMETLSLHEAAPGHHFQVAIQQELTDLPRFRRFGGYYVAYTEGWALYAESLGKELGLFSDPYQYYGRLSDEMLRAMRLVVDTGLHALGWSREQAIDYMLENSSMARSDVVAEVERYIASPGQALGYKIGQLRISAMRARAEQALGEHFDVRAFHSVILRDGSLPMDVLDAKVDRWIEARRAKTVQEEEGV
jgi:uncharacterized protein (DUF885 family)